MAALASLTTNYSDSEEEDDRSETPEMLVQPDITEEADQIQSSEEAEKIQEAEQLPSSEEVEQLPSSEETDTIRSSEEINKILTSSAAEDLGPILGPQTKPVESWSYKGLRDFSKTASDNPSEEDESAPASTIDSSCYSYEGDVCIYTDPTTSSQYTWDEASSTWEPRQTDVAKNYVFDGNTYWYKDTSGAKFRWSNEGNKWENVMDDCPMPDPDTENSSVMGPQGPSPEEEASSMIGPSYPQQLPRSNEAAAYNALLVDTAPAIKSKVSGDRAARQLNHYMDYEAYERQANIGFEKPKFTKKQIQLLRRRKQDKKYKKSLEWLKKDY